MDTAELKARIAARDVEIDQLRRLNSVDSAEVRKRESVAAINALGVTKANTFTTDGDDKPWFGHIKDYIAWIGAQEPRLPWAEWNQMVYQTHDLIAGYMHESIIRYEDVQ